MKYEITREQIIELALRSDKASIWLQQNFKDAFKPVLEVGKWYKCIEKGFESLICITNHENAGAYGFSYYGKNNKNIWCENGYRGWSFKSDPETWIEATEQEVFEAFKNEAVKRGYKLVSYISRLFDKKLKDAVIDNKTFIEDKEWFYDLKNDYLEHHGFVVYSKGQWAEIIPTITKQEAEALLNKKIID